MVEKRDFSVCGAILAGLFVLATSPVHAKDRPKETDPFRLLWKVQLETVLYTAATLADLDGDGMDEIVVAGMNSVIAMDGGGKVLWQWSTPERLNTYPSVWVRDKAPALIYVGDDVHHLTCVDGTGKTAWEAELKGPVNWTSASLADLTGDGQLEVVQPDGSGVIWAFDALSGKPLWETPVTGTIGCSPSIGDLSGDGRPEIVVATEAGFLTALSPEGTILWSFQAGRSLYSAPVIFPTGQGAPRVVAGSSDGECFCLDRDGKWVWSRPLGSSTDSSISVGDLDRDGRPDIFAVTTGGVLFRLDETGETVWSLDMQMRTDASGALADIDDDGSIEYVLCTHQGRILVLRQNGQIQLERSLGIPNAYNATPTFGEANPDSPGLEAVVCGGDSGWIFCFGTRAQAGPSLQWAGVRRDRHMTGAWSGQASEAEARMVPLNLSWDLLIEKDGAQFGVSAPAEVKRPLRAEATVISPKAGRGSVVARIHGSEGIVTLPVELGVPGLYEFSWHLEDADGKALAQGERDVTLDPFRNERACVDSALLKLEQAAQGVRDRLPLSAGALDEERAYLLGASQSLTPLQDRSIRGDSSNREMVLSSTSQLVDRARRASRIAEVISQSDEAGSGASLIPFEASLWSSRDIDLSLPDRAQSNLTLQRRVVPGEHEPVAVNLLNITNRALRIRVMVHAPEGVKAKAYRAEPVPTTMGEQSWDALPILDGSMLMEIPPMETRQLWVDVALSPDCQTGPRSLEVALLVLNGAGVLEGPKSGRAVPPGEVKIALDLEVLPFQMAPKTSCRMCTWAGVDSSGLKHCPEAAYEDLLDHGNNVFVAPLSRPIYDKQGQLKGNVDYKGLDQVVDRLRDRGAFILLSGIPGGDPEPGADGPGSEAHLQAVRAHCEDIVSHMKSKGFELDEYALYPFDEPGGRDGWKGIQALVDVGKMMDSAYPDLKIYTNAYGPAGPSMIEALVPTIDVWSPPVNLVSMELEKMSIMRATGKPIWSYNCSYNNYGKPTQDAGSLKIGDVVSEYRVAGIWAFRHGLSGLGFWTYCSSPEDPWSRTATEYMMVYTGQDGPITSRRWEGVREGIEDFRILEGLRQAMENAKSSWPESVQKEVRAFLDESLPQFADGVTDEEALRTFREGLMDAVQAAAAP